MQTQIEPFGGIELMKTAAQRHDTEAETILGGALERGIEGKAGFKEATALYARAASHQIRNTG